MNKTERRRNHWMRMALCLPAALVAAVLLERRFHLLPDVVAVPYILALLLLVPTCIGCGTALSIVSWKRANTLAGKLVGLFLGILEIGVGIALGIGLVGVKFITPQT